MQPIRLLSTALLLPLLALVARAEDAVVVRSGSVYTGKIVAEDDNAVTIDTSNLGRMQIQKADVTKVQRDVKPADGGKAGDGKTPAVGKSPPAPSKGGEKVTEKPSTDRAPDRGAADPKADRTAATKKGADAKDAAAPASPEEKGRDERSKDEKGKDEKAAKAGSANKETDAALSADDRDARRKQAKIIRKTAPDAPKTADGKAAHPPEDAPDAAGSVAAAAPEEKASIGGAQLAQAERGSWVIVFQPPRQFESAANAIQVGRRLFARLDSAGVASAWLTVPMTAGEERVPLRLADVQRHATVKPGGSRLRMVEGIDKGAWLRARLSDGTTEQGMLLSTQGTTVTLGRPRDDGTTDKVEIEEQRLIEVDGLMRSTGTRLALNEAAIGEPIALTWWPDGREIFGTVADRAEGLVKVELQDGTATTIAQEGPIADTRRVPTKWRAIALGIGLKGQAHVKSVEEFPDARVERDLVGSVVGLTAYGLAIANSEGAAIVPFESITSLAAVQTETEAAAGRPLDRSDRRCSIPVLPGAPAAKAREIDGKSGVTVIADAKSVTHVFVTAPFDGEVFGMRLGMKFNEAMEQTDLRFDTTVVPRAQESGATRPAELVSHTLKGMRVTIVLDVFGAIRSLEVAAR